MDMEDNTKFKMNLFLLQPLEDEVLCRGASSRWRLAALIGLAQGQGGEQRLVFSGLSFKSKTTVVSVRTTKTYRRTRGIAPIILNLSTRWRWAVNHTLATLPLQKEPLITWNRKLGGSQSRSGRLEKRKIYFLGQNQTLDCPTCSKSLYQLCYSGSCGRCCTKN